MINMEDQEIQSHFEHLIFYIPSMIVSVTVLVLLLDSLVSKISCCLFGAITKIHLLIEEEQQQPELTQKTSADLEADNKQLRELVTSLHQKQQTTSLEVICN